jgi:hypothetical protein
MRRQTNTINFSSELPLAQGIQFGSDDVGSATAKMDRAYGRDGQYWRAHAPSHAVCVALVGT